MLPYLRESIALETVPVLSLPAVGNTLFFTLSPGCAFGFVLTKM
jgi:hypothetical protein